MARRQKNDSDLLMEDELTAAFLDDATPMGIEEQPSQNSPQSQQTSSDDDWDEDQLQEMPGMLAVDVYETKEKLFIKARTAGVNRDDLDVSIADNTLTIKGTLSSGDEIDAEDYHIQECF